MYLYRIPEELMESGDHGKALVFAVILRLTSKDGKCFASNRYIAEKIGRKDNTIVKDHIQELKKEGWITVDNPHSKRRIIHINRGKLPQVWFQPGEKTTGNRGKFPHRRNTSEDIYNPKEKIDKKETSLFTGKKSYRISQPVDNHQPHTSHLESLKSILTRIKPNQ